MLSVLSYVVAGMCLSSAAALVVSGRNRPSAARSFFAAGMASLGAAMALVAPATLAIARELEPFPHTARFLSNTLGMLAACCALAMLAFVLETPSRARRMVLRDFTALAVVVAARAAIWIYASPPASAEVTAGLGSDPAIAVYVLLHVGYMAIGMLRFAWRIRRFAAGTTSRAVLIGVRLTLIGLVFGCTWALWKTGVIGVQVVGLAHVDTASGPSLLLSGLCALFVAAGGSYAIWSRPMRILSQHVRRRRAYRQLEPLWTDVAAALPRIHLDAPDANLQEACYRRVIEVRDAQLALDTYVPDEVREEATRAALARGDDVDQARVVAEAASLATGLDAFRRGARRPNTTSAAGNAAVGQHADTLAEAAWLLRVDHARQHDPIVTAIRQHHQNGVQTADMR